MNSAAVTIPLSDEKYKKTQKVAKNNVYLLMLMKAFSMTTIFRKIDRHTLEAKTDDISLVNHSQSELHQIKNQ